MRKWSFRVGVLCVVLGIFMSQTVVMTGTAHATPTHASSNYEKGLVDHIHPADVEALGGQVPEGVTVVDHEPGFWEKFEWGVVVGGVIQGNTDDSADWESQTDGMYHIDIEALFPVTENGSVYTLIEAGGGNGVDGRIASFSGWSDYTWGDDDITIAELWYEHSWADGRYRGRIGKIDLSTDFDTNEYANDEHYAFTSSGFINNLAIELPDYSFGGMFWWQPTEQFSVGVGYQSNNDWDDVFHNGFGILEFGWHPVFCGHQGNYRFYGWASAHGDGEDEDGNFVDGYTNSGWGLSFDQEITAHIGLWCRYGAQSNKEFNAFKAHTSFGVQFMNFYYRPDDALGLAYGIVTLADAYAESLEEADDEEHIELYYRAQINEKIALTPHLQWITNPEGDATRDDALVVGFRGTFML